MTNLTDYNSSEVATILGEKREWVQAFALKRGYPKYGKRYLFTREDIELMREYLDKLIRAGYRQRP